jgi:3-oxoacyl-(acyl-carrier-protein) synthase
MIEPFHREDVTMISDGGAALVITSAERAADMPNRPVYVLGMAEATGHRLDRYDPETLMRPWLADAAARPMSRHDPVTRATRPAPGSFHVPTCHVVGVLTTRHPLSYNKRSSSRFCARVVRGSSMRQLGVVHPLPAIPVDWDVTRMIPAGVLELGLEFRNLDEDAIRQAFPDAQRDPDHPVESDSGFSIHVFEASTRVERLRFDCFHHDPHYHYLGPGERNFSVAFDRAANGDMFQWTLGVLGAHVETMLAETGASDLSVEATEFHAALGELEAMAQALAADPRGVPAQ